MKTLKIILTLLFLNFGLANAQEISIDKVPEAIKTYFKIKFPNAVKAEWEMDGQNYEVDFKSDNAKWSAVFLSDGTVFKTEKSIKVSELPIAVKIAVEKEIPGFKIDDAEFVSTIDGTEFYELELEKGKIEWEIQITAEGKILKKTEEK